MIIESRKGDKKMTKYSCDIHTAEDWESIALFSDKVSFEAMGAFIGAEFECGNSLYAPCDAIRVVDMDTGEVVLEAEVGDGDDEDDYDLDWGYNEDMGFDPYMGCYTDDC
jgi:hypothetical protein